MSSALARVALSTVMGRKSSAALALGSLEQMAQPCQQRPCAC